MSHKTVVRLIEQLGENHDARVREWQEELSKKLTFEEVCCIKMGNHDILIDFYHRGRFVWMQV